MTGIVAAKWLASLTRRRARRARSARPERLARALEHRRRRLLGVHARPAADQLGVQPDAVDLGGDRVEHALDRLEVVGAHVAEELAAAGTTLNASPQRMTVGTAVRCAGPCGSCARGDRLRGRASASSALRPRSGAEPECALRPVRR